MVSTISGRNHQLKLPTFPQHLPDVPGCSLLKSCKQPQLASGLSFRTQTACYINRSIVHRIVHRLLTRHFFITPSWHSLLLLT